MEVKGTDKGNSSNVDKYSFYEKGPVQILGYGLPKLSFDSRHISLLNPEMPTISNTATESPSYVLDLGKMSPMQGKLVDCM